MEKITSKTGEDKKREKQGLPKSNAHTWKASKRCIDARSDMALSFTVVNRACIALSGHLMLGPRRRYSQLAH